jgi:hypothetical protein
MNLTIDEIMMFAPGGQDGQKKTHTDRQHVCLYLQNSNNNHHHNNNINNRHMVQNNRVV